MFDKGIYKRSGLIYSVLATLFFIPFRLFYYRKVVIRGLKNIPRGKPILFAPNHQNALIDPLAVTFTSIMPMSYLARSDIFKEGFISLFLQKIKMLPVYRLRDGAEKLKLNEDVFKFSVTILENRMPMVIFPEATHTDKRCLQSLKKGVPRLVFQAEEDNNWNLDLQVMPVGLYYDDYPAFQSTVQVIYGNPIRVADFKDAYLQNKAKGLNALRMAITNELIPNIINIESKEHYDTYEILRDMYAPVVSKKMGHKKFSQYNKFLADKQIIDNLADFEKEQADSMKKLSEEVIEYNNAVKKHELTDSLIDNGITMSDIFIKVLILIVGFPIFVYGAMLNVLPTVITLSPIKKIKDIQFHSTVKYTLGSVVFFFTHIIYAVIASLFFNIYWVLLFFFTLSYAGVWAYRYTQVFTRLKCEIRYKKFLSDDKLTDIIDKRKNITKKMQTILK